MDPESPHWIWIHLPLRLCSHTFATGKPLLCPLVKSLLRQQLLHSFNGYCQTYMTCTDIELFLYVLTLNYTLVEIKR